MCDARTYRCFNRWSTVPLCQLIDVCVRVCVERQRSFRHQFWPDFIRTDSVMFFHRIGFWDRSHLYLCSVMHTNGVAFGLAPLGHGHCQSVRMWNEKQPTNIIIISTGFIYSKWVGRDTVCTNARLYARARNVSISRINNPIDSAVERIETGRRPIRVCDKPQNGTNTTQHKRTRKCGRVPVNTVLSALMALLALRKSHGIIRSIRAEHWCTYHVQCKC